MEKIEKKDNNLKPNNKSLLVLNNMTKQEYLLKAFEANLFPLVHTENIN